MLLTPCPGRATPRSPPSWPAPRQPAARPARSGRAQPVDVPPKQRRRPELCRCARRDLRARAGGDRGPAGDCSADRANELRAGVSACGKARWLLVLVTFLDLWVLGRHRLLDVGPVEAPRRAEPGPGDARAGTAGHARSPAIDSRTCRCSSGWRRSRPIARSICRPCPS